MILPPANMEEVTWKGTISKSKVLVFQSHDFVRGYQIFVSFFGGDVLINMLMPSMGLVYFPTFYHQNEPFILVNIPFVPWMGHGMNHQQKIRQNEVVLCWKIVFGIPPARWAFCPEPIVTSGVTCGPYKWPYKWVTGDWGCNPTYELIGVFFAPFYNWIRDHGSALSYYKTPMFAVLTAALTIPRMMMDTTFFFG